jgi:hypothetical protein
MRGRAQLVMLLALAALVAGLIGAVPSHALPARARPATHATLVAPTWRSGVFNGYGPAGDLLFASWRGRPVQTATDFVGGDNWLQIEDPAWDIVQWATEPSITPVLSVQLWPASGGDFADAAAGHYDSYYATMARNLVLGGLSHAVLRIGWEFNGDWYRWSVTSRARAAQFVQAWRHIVRAIRAVPGEHFSFDWCMNLGPSRINPARSYPGSKYVDTIGADVYDWNSVAGQTPAQRWSSLVNGKGGLAWQARFAAREHRRVAFPEWGVVSDDNDPSLAGGDDPAFIRHMHHWFATHRPSFEDYFDADTTYGMYFGLTTNNRFARSQAEYLKLFS